MSLMSETTDDGEAAREASARRAQAEPMPAELRAPGYLRAQGKP